MNPNIEISGKKSNKSYDFSRKNELKNKKSGDERKVKLMKTISEKKFENDKCRGIVHKRRDTCFFLTKSVKRVRKFNTKHDTGSE